MKNFAVSALTAVIYIMEETIGRHLSANSGSNVLPPEYHATCSINNNSDALPSDEMVP